MATGPACSGLPAHHLDVCAADNGNLARVLDFRDFLRIHSDTGHSYVKLKRSLAQRFCTDRAAYTAAKTAFIDDVVARALSEQSRRGDG
ncbi:GrpB family protein [Amycolatopsis halotolerans]|uniref:GrpB family protein n=1 Tax=Amycolatopsis halotolerans TaxID=330083 RepID=A0ABV7QGM8_9PSEU